MDCIRCLEIVKCYDKEIDFNLAIVYFSLIYRNIAVAYGVYSSQLKRYSCVCSFFEDDRGLHISSKSHRWRNGQRARLECGRSWVRAPVG